MARVKRRNVTHPPRLISAPPAAIMFWSQSARGPSATGATMPAAVARATGGVA